MDHDPHRPIPGNAPDDEQRDAPLTGEILEPGIRGNYQGWNAGGPFNDREGVGGWLFGPRTFGGGRVQVYGCSPGCIVLSLVVSVILSLLLTLILNAIL